MKKTDEKKNASQLPSLFYCKHMETGLCGYEDETILIDGDDIKKMIPTFNGKPLYVLHQDVDVENLQEKADGYVVESFYNELDGWLWAKFIAVSDDAHDVIGRGWSVSNAYIPTEWGTGGTHHNVAYNRKITGGEFTHLALVPNPRYEEARVFTPAEFKDYQSQKRNNLQELHNSKSNLGVKKMFRKMFKTDKKEVASLDEATSVVLENGKEIDIAEMVNAVIEAEKANEAKEEEKINMDAEVKVGDKTMPIRELVNKYNNLTKENTDDKDEDDKKEKDNKKNSDAGDDKEKANEDKKEEKENTDAEDDKKNEDGDDKKEDEKKNAKHFEQLCNAGFDGESNVKVIETSSSMVQRGNDRYGS